MSVENKIDFKKIFNSGWKPLKTIVASQISKFRKHYSNNKIQVTGAIIAGIALLWLMLKISANDDFSKKLVVKYYQPKSVENGRILGSTKDIYDRKSNLNNRKFNAVQKENKELREKTERLSKDIGELKYVIDEMKKEKNEKDREPSKTNEDESKLSGLTKTNAPEVQFSPTPDSLMAEQIEPLNTTNSVNADRSRPRTRKSFTRLGPTVINFPVEAKSSKSKDQIVVPSGSFVSATLLTGVEAPEGKALPTLLKANEAYVGPNKTRIDLTGCFFIGKSTGNLSIERVELQVVKLSCVSKSGRSFEKAINGFVADNKDNSFAVVGSVNAKRDRVAALAFLSSIVEGVGKAVQNAQTTNQVNSNGGSSSIVTGDQAKYMAAGGAATAATRITEFYLKHAESLLPTINIGSGQKIFIVMQEKIELPNWYFRKSKKTKNGHFSYLSRVLE